MADNTDMSLYFHDTAIESYNICISITPQNTTDTEGETFEHHVASLIRHHSSSCYSPHHVTIDNEKNAKVPPTTSAIPVTRNRIPAMHVGHRMFTRDKAHVTRRDQQKKCLPIVMKTSSPREGHVTAISPLGVG